MVGPRSYAERGNPPPRDHRDRPTVEVPRWVPAKLHLDYLLRAERDGEEAAASWARTAKKALAR